MVSTQVVGILGGMGPAAGADFVRLFVQACAQQMRARGEPVRDQSFPEHWLAQALPTTDGGPEAAHLRRQWLDAIAAALDELPAGPRDVFVAHEIDGRSFKDMAAESGVPLNTLLGWKRQAVLHLRARLAPLYVDHS